MKKLKMLIQQYLKFPFWSKLAVWGTIASFVGFMFTIVNIIIPEPGEVMIRKEATKAVSDRGAFAGNQQLLQDELNKLESSWYTISEKIEKLRNQYIIETREEEKFRLTKLINESEKDREKIQQDIDSIRNRLSSEERWTYELSHKECLKLVKDRQVYEVLIKSGKYLKYAIEKHFPEDKAGRIEVEREKLENEKNLSISKVS